MAVLVQNYNKPTSWRRLLARLAKWASSMNLSQMTSSDGSSDSTDHEGEGESVLFHMEASGDHTVCQFNESGSSGGSCVANKSHESLVDDGEEAEALSPDIGKIY